MFSKPSPASETITNTSTATMSRTTWSTDLKPDSKASQNNVADWTSMMLAIDLEGINTKGYGYQVMISGPQQRPRQNKGVIELVMAKLCGRKARPTEQNDTQDFQIPMETEVIVSHSVLQSPISRPLNQKLVSQADGEHAMENLNLQPW
jgi:hypothetical protein